MNFVKKFLSLTLIFCSTIVLGQTDTRTNSGGTSTPPVWEDPVLIPRTTPIKAAHMNQLRTQINTNLISCGRPAKTWTDSPIVPGATPIKRIHMEELRLATNELVIAYRQRQGLPGLQNQPTYTDQEIRPGNTVIKAAHFQELRAAVALLSCGPAPVTCNPSRTYSTSAACAAAEGRACVSTTSAAQWVWTMTGGTSTGCAGGNSGCGLPGYVLNYPVGNCSGPADIGRTSSYGCGCDSDGTFLRAYFRCQASVSWSCVP